VWPHKLNYDWLLIMTLIMNIVFYQSLKVLYNLKSFNIWKPNVYPNEECCINVLFRLLPHSEYEIMSTNTIIKSMKIIFMQY